MTNLQGVFQIAGAAAGSFQRFLLGTLVITIKKDEKWGTPDNIVVYRMMITTPAPTITETVQWELTDKCTVEEDPFTI